ncbi:MAG: patatin-like phospholipase family protein [Deltaproteobacteria bacterium]|nr:patatin-like phospholipase family protein [Deltaproteobacteria bacterium]
MLTRPHLTPKERARRRALLRETAGFADLDQTVLDAALDRIASVRLFAGEWLFRGGEPGDRMYLVMSGRVEVIREGADSVLAVVGPGETIGELAVLTQADRSASVRALRDAELLEIGADLLGELLAQHPAFGASLARVLARRLHDAARQVTRRRPRLGVLAVMVLGDPAIADEVLAHIVACLEPEGRVDVLTGEEIQSAGLDPDAAAAAYAGLVDRHEHDAAVTVLHVDARAASPFWARFALRQADRVVLLVDSRSDTRDLELLPEFAERAVAFYDRPPGVASWLRLVAPASHHFIDPGADLQRTVARMMRRLAGRSLGVVLSGGGARGLAHIGVLEALEQAGLTIDRVAGTSVGALVAGLYATGITPWEIRDVCLREVRAPFDDFTVPMVALSRGRRMERMLQRIYGDALIEELSIDFFCVSADLVSAQAVVHRSGSLAAAVAASASIPGVAPPRVHEGRLLVDGGVLNNLPTDIMAARAEGPIIASDVMNDDEVAHSGRPHRPSRTIAQRLVRRLPAVDARLPTIVETLSRASLLGSVHAAHAQRELADLVILPDVAGFPFMDFGAIDPLITAGREAARHALATAPDLD